MNKLLESLWYDYISQEPGRLSDELRAVRCELRVKEDALFGELNNTQKSALLEYEDCLNELHAVCEKDAFVRGIRFAVRFLLDAVSGG
ncbi:MAG: hypothetical protein IJF78_11235 [Clostridia bacterium]|nr:hypothetical protein [Clostridia bacterium]